MAFKTIVAYLARPESARSVIDVALPVAESFDAHLVGMHAAAGIPVAGTIGAQVPPEIIEQYRDLLREEARKIAGIFAERTKGAGPPVEWCGQEEKKPWVDLLDAIAGQAVCADLVVMGQSDGDASRGELAAEVVMGTGRPVLIVPQEGAFKKVGERVTVAWDASREAARAAFDAVPLLQKAKEVCVLTIDAGGGEYGKAASEELAQVLSRHGVAVKAADTSAGKLSAGERLIAYSKDEGSDLLVMGCYGHSRLRERLFGGATRHVLKTMTIPVLMSH